MSDKAVETLIANAIHAAFIKPPDGDGGPNLDYEWITPDQSTRIAKAILQDLAESGFLIVSKVATEQVSYSRLRTHLASYMDKVCDSHAPVFVTRQNERSVVMLSKDDYEGLMETVHLLKSPANAARLLRSIKDVD